MVRLDRRVADDDRAQAQVLGVILMVGVVVVAVTALTLGLYDPFPGGETPLARFEAEAVATGDFPASDELAVNVTHAGGHELDTTDVVVVVNRGYSTRYDAELGSLTGADDGTWSPGERWSTGDTGRLVNETATLDVFVVYEPTNETLYRDTIQVQNRTT